MFEISELKEKKLPELQEIAKELKISRYSALKKLDLIYQIWASTVLFVSHLSIKIVLRHGLKTG